MPWHRIRFALPAGALAVALGFATAAARPQPAAPKQTVVLISLDGFRWDYFNRPAAKRIRALAATGVRAERLVPAFPSKTYPNHYSLATGLYPEHHGIIANVIRDSVLGRFSAGTDPSVRDARWWGGEPIWVTAERQHVHAASFFWPGSEAPIGGFRPSWYHNYDGAVPNSERVRGVLDWLALPADSAPRVITMYLSDTDGAGHDFGPASPQVDSAIAREDSVVGAVVDGIARLRMTDRVNVIIVSDHGMAAASPERYVYLDDYVSLDSLDIVDWTPVAAIAPKPGHAAYVYAKLHGANPHLAVYWKADVPPRLHFSTNPRITPIVGIADDGWVITTRQRAARATKVSRGEHGYDNQLSSMGALFVANGPAFRSGLVVPPFQNVHVYELVAHIAGLTPAPNDGSLDSVRALLKK
jgi:predicted AlkP superfamily pyrophosphatase or phosphodiesterase